MRLQGSHRYDDIINLSHHQSKTHAHMSVRNRAAQFMPFAALTGYDDVIERAALANEEAVERANAPVDVTDGYMPA